jgi:hypothetical protein
MEETCVRCEAGLMTRQFYVFPCGHGFHADCLIKQVRLSEASLYLACSGQSRLLLSG